MDTGGCGVGGFEIWCLWVPPRLFTGKQRKIYSEFARLEIVLRYSLYQSRMVALYIAFKCIVLSVNDIGNTVANTNVAKSVDLRFRRPRESFVFPFSFSPFL